MAEDKKKLMEAAEGELSEDALEGAAGGRYVAGKYFGDEQTVVVVNPGSNYDAPRPDFGLSGR